jgi:acyl-CoA dehydrogenase
VAPATGLRGILRDEFADAARTLVSNELAPIARAVDESGEIPPWVRDRLAELGYFGLRIPEEFGGVGLTLSQYLGVVRELARTNLAFQELTEENNGIGSAALLLAGTEHQKRHWLPRLASGEVIGAFALTEPGAGADAAAIATTARPCPGGYLLNGTKHFITHGADAQLLTVVARVAGTGGDDSGVTLFLVTPETPGFSVGRVQPMMGYRASRQAELVFDDAFVPDDGVLGAPGAGFAVAMQTLDTGRLTVAADCLGAAEEVLGRAISYACVRRTFGRRLIEHGQVRELLARSSIELRAVAAAIEELARRIDDGEQVRSGAAALKLFASEVAGRVADRAMQVHGGLGYTVEAEIERVYRDVRVLRIAEGPSEVLRNTIARADIAAVDARKETVL